MAVPVKPPARAAAANYKAPARSAGKPGPVGEVTLPVLAEFLITASVILLIAVFLGVVITSIVTGVSLWALVLRTSLSVAVVGTLLYLLLRQALPAIIKAEEEAAKEKEEERRKKMDEEAALQGLENSLEAK